MTSLLKTVPLVAPGHTRPVTHLSFSPIQHDGTYLLVSSCKDGNPMLRDWTGDWIGTFLGHKGAVWSTKLSVDTRVAVSGSADFTAKVWDAFSGNVLHSFPHDHIVRTVAISPDSKKIVTGGQEKKVRIFDLQKSDAQPTLLSDAGSISHDGTVKSVVWFDVNTVATASEDGTIKWWDVRNSRPVSSSTFSTPITSMEYSSRTGRLVVTYGKTVAFIHATPNFAPTHSLTLLYKPSSASVHPISQDRFVTGSLEDQWVRIHNMDGEEKEILKGHHGPVHCVEFSPDGEMYASGSEDGTIRLWQTTPGKSYGLWQGVS